MNTIQLSKSDELKFRVLKAKQWLPRNYRKQVIELLPHLNSLEGGDRIYNVSRLIVVDEKITEALEQIAIENGMPVNTSPAA